MELRGYCSAVQDIETFMTKLVNKKQAEKIKDTSVPFLSPFDKNGELIKSENYVRVYQLFVGKGNWLTVDRVNVRFWYDERYNKASIKISQRGMDALIAKAPELLGKDVIDIAGKLDIASDEISM
jgi:hypothetical protein